jgi:hypothetical protein
LAKAGVYVISYTQLGFCSLKEGILHGIPRGIQGDTIVAKSPWIDRVRSCSKTLDLQAFLMGRAGIEPATLGLKVRANKLKRTARYRKALQTVPIMVATS